MQAIEALGARGLRAPPRHENTAVPFPYKAVSNTLTTPRTIAALALDRNNAQRPHPQVTQDGAPGPTRPTWMHKVAELLKENAVLDMVNISHLSKFVSRRKRLGPVCLPAPPHARRTAAPDRLATIGCV